MTNTRRDLLKLIGAVGGTSLVYPAMQAMGAAPLSGYHRQMAELKGAPAKGASVLVLGAGLAGLVAALELTKAGYKVELLEYSQRVGGRALTIRGGDSFTELGGSVQNCTFEPGHYFNPGPMRIPHSHHAYIDYCRRLGVAIEPFLNVSANNYVHSTTAFGGRPQRYKSVRADVEGHIAEIAAKSANQHLLDKTLSKQDLEQLLEALRSWGALDMRYRYQRDEPLGPHARAGGDEPAPPGPRVDLQLEDLLRSSAWRAIAHQHDPVFDMPMFQPVGGMDMLPKALAREVGHLVRYDAKVVEIRQDDAGVTVAYADEASGGTVREARADWCVCAIPPPILGQIPMQVGGEMSAAISAIYFASSVKVALQFKRRFWEQDKDIYGGITATDLPINEIVYPSYGYGGAGKGVLVGAYVGTTSNSRLTAFEISSATPAERIEWALREGAKIHPQYRAEYDSGLSVAWHRVPFSLGCYTQWRPGDFEQHYKKLRTMDGRIALAGEHVSYFAGWQEGAILGALGAVGQIHMRALASKA